MYNKVIFANQTTMVVAEYPLAVVRYTVYIGKNNANTHTIAVKRIEKPAPIKVKREAPKLLSVPTQRRTHKKLPIPVIKVSVNLASIVSAIDLYLRHEHQIQDFINSLF